MSPRRPHGRLAACCLAGAATLWLACSPDALHRDEGDDDTDDPSVDLGDDDDASGDVADDDTTAEPSDDPPVDDPVDDDDLADDDSADPADDDTSVDDPADDDTSVDDPADDDDLDDDPTGDDDDVIADGPCPGPMVTPVESCVDGECFIPAGWFVMGAQSTDPDGLNYDPWAEPDESPPHCVYLDAFWMDQFEATAGEMMECIEAGACNPEHVYRWAPWPGDADDWVGPNATVGHEDRANLAAVGTWWQAASDYCAWRGKRLPTEAEWEYAARGTDRRWYSWGNDEPTCELAVIDDHSAGGDGCGTDLPMVPGSRLFGRSPFGLLDMIGNAEEWSADTYQADYYAGSVQWNPSGPEGGEERTVRGGSFSSASATFHDVRASSRYGIPSDRGDGTAGVRCAQ